MITIPLKRTRFENIQQSQFKISIAQDTEPKDEYNIINKKEHILKTYTSPSSKYPTPSTQNLKTNTISLKKNTF